VGSGDVPKVAQRNEVLRIQRERALGRGTGLCDRLLSFLRRPLPLLSLLGMTLVLSLAACRKDADQSQQQGASGQGNAPGPVSGPTISGTVTVSPALAAKIKSDAVLFIIAHPSGQHGPPAAVKRITPIKLPVAFTLTENDVMLKGMPFAGKMDLTARIANDGGAMRAPGDLEGTSQGAVAVGEAGVTISVDKQD